jgi:CDP-diacylglycerol--glycerol-3-phosphate 3-phosphatidyltransferase
MTAFHLLLGVLGVLVASMGVYAALGRRSDPDAARKGSQFLLGVGDFLVHWFMWLISPLERLFLRLGFTPDVFNFLGLGLGLLSGFLIAAGELELGGWAIAAGGVCDIFDGRIARARGMSSPYGKFIDSTFDRFVEVFAFLGFVVYLRATTWGPLLASAAMAGSLLVSYAQARGETVNVSGSGGLMQRAERLVLMCLVCLTDRAITSHLSRPPGTAVLWVLGFMAVATFATAAHRTLWIARRLRATPTDSGR